MVLALGQARARAPDRCPACSQCNQHSAGDCEHCLGEGPGADKEQRQELPGGLRCVLPGRVMLVSRQVHDDLGCELPGWCARLGDR